MRDAGLLNSDDGWLRMGLRQQVVMLLLAAFFAVVAVIIQPLDLPCAGGIPGFLGATGPWLGDLVALVRPFGHGEMILFLVLALGAAGRRRVAQEGLLALILVAALVWAIKVPVGRIRPNGDTFSFPSGDVATCALLIPLMWNYGTRQAKWFAGVALALTLGVCLGRVVKNFHYLSDVAAGVTVGMLAGILAHTLNQRYCLPGLGWVKARWYVLATLLVGAGSWVGVLLKIQGGDLNPLMPPFLAAVLPGVLLLIAAPWVRTWDAGQLDGRKLATVLTLAAGGLLLLLAGASSLWDRDETFYAQTAQEMLRSGSWLVPTFNGEPFLHKPPLVFWLMAGSSKVLGNTEIAFRLWSCGAMVGILGLLGWLASRLIAPASGLRLIGLFATMPLMLVVGGAATTDALLLLCLIIAMLPWFLALAKPEGDPARTNSSWPRALVMGLGMGLGMLTKAPLGLAVPGASLLLAWWLMRRASRVAVATARVLPPPPLFRDLTIASVIGMLIYLAWAIPTNSATNGQFWEIAVLKHIIGRAAAPMENHGGPLWRSFPYYGVVVLVACLPWTAYLPAMLSSLLGGRLGDVRLRVVALAWFLPTFVGMTLVATKLPHYIVPALPGLALALVATLAAAESGALNPKDLRWLDRGRWLLAGLFGIVGLGLIVAPWFLPLEDPRPAAEAVLDLWQLRHGAVGAGIVFLALPFLVWRAWLVRPVAAARWLATGMVVIVLSASLFVLPSLNDFKSSDAVGRAVNRAAAPGVPVATAGFDEPSLLFALDRAPVPELSSDEVRRWATQAGPGVLVATPERLTEAGVVPGRNGLTLLDQRLGYNYNRGRWLTLVTVGRHLPPRTP